MRNPFRLSLSATAFLVFVAASAGAVEPLEPGVAAPAWKDLPGVDGKGHSLADHKDAQVVVVAFSSNSCPYSVAYEDRFIAFTKEYAPRGVVFVAINVSPEPQDELEPMKARAKEKEFPFAYLRDKSQKIGKEYGARVTPQIFVLDENRKVAYVGAFDDRRDESKVQKRHVKDAVEELLKGQSPTVTKTRAAGCAIRYD